MRAAGLRCHIRPMQPGDIPQVLDIERQSFPTMWPQTAYQRELKNELARYLVAYEPADEDTPAEEPPDEEPSARGIRGLMRRIIGSPPPATRERLLGLVGLWCMMGEGHIVTIAVRPEDRRMGIGELLLVAALQAALEAGQDEVTLEYRVSNRAARALYDKYGFSQVGVRARYYTDNQEDAVIMTTPPMSSPAFRRLLAERIAGQRARWGEDYPLTGKVEGLTKATPNGRS
jgi:ribosomal-protein-alanine N-acetyltransferase